MNIDNRFEVTRWRFLDNPVSPLDPIQPDSPVFTPGKLPVGFVMLVWEPSLKRLGGPVRFETQQDADDYQALHKIESYLVIPKP